MARVRLTADVEAETRRRVKIAAIRSDVSVSEWIERAVLHELEREPDGTADDNEERVILPPPGAKPRGSEHPVRMRGDKTMAETVLEDRGGR
jgi:hypothetical protein